jgi:DNA-directed RNA polymerase subunit omega
MARVTVEDCLKVIPNRFELALIAVQRAKVLLNGSQPLYDTDKNEKSTIVALREIGDELLDVEQVKESIKEDIRNKKFLERSGGKPFNKANQYVDDIKENEISENDVVLEDVDEKLLADESRDIDSDIEEDDEDDNNFNNVDTDDIDNKE